MFSLIACSRANAVVREGLKHSAIWLQEVFEYQAGGMKNAVGFRYMHFYPTIGCGDGKLRGTLSSAATASRVRLEGPDSR